jgi:CheY-like chemotaxis protein
MLVVDDEPINRRVARYAAERLGLDVDEAASGESALSALGVRRYDLVLLDLHLSGMSGLDVARSLQGRGAEDGPAVIGYTGTVQEADRRHLAEAGVAEILGKPLDRGEFDAAVGRALHARKRLTRRTQRNAAAVAPVLAPAGMIELARMMGSPQSARELLVEFVAELDARIAVITAASDAGDDEAVADRCHALASTAATFGALRLSRALRQLELVASRREHARVAELALELPTLTASTSTELNGYLAAHP